MREGPSGSKDCAPVRRLGERSRSACSVLVLRPLGTDDWPSEPYVRQVRRRGRIGGQAALHRTLAEDPMRVPEPDPGVDRGGGTVRPPGMISTGEEGGNGVMNYDQVSIRTQDGECPAYVFTPPGWPASGCDLLHGRARDRADDSLKWLSGWPVIRLPRARRPICSTGPAATSRRSIRRRSSPPATCMGGDRSPFASADNRRAAEDTEAFLAYLDSREDVAGTKVGTTGYCMGGAISLTAAGTYPDRVARGGQLPRRQLGHRFRTQPAPACACDGRSGLCRRG